jgi:hypothetical protein
MNGFKMDISDMWAGVITFSSQDNCVSMVISQARQIV